MNLPKMNNQTGNYCAPVEGYTVVRFTLISLASLVSCIGIVFNIILTWLFLGPPRKQFNSNTLYLGVLSLVDFTLCFLYLFLFEMDAFAYYLNIKAAYDFYYWYLVATFIASKVVQLAIPYVLMFATFERFLITAKKTYGYWRLFTSSTSCQIIIFLVIILSIITRTPLFWALKIEEQLFMGCQDYFRTKAIMPTNFFGSNEFQFFDTYIMQTFQIFIPFVVLVTLNILIICKLKDMKKQRKESFFNQKGIGSAIGQMSLIANFSGSGVSRELRNQIEEDNRKLRNAISTVGILCGTHLLCNSINVILTILERSKAEILLNPENNAWADWYITTGDVLSFLFMLCSVVRLIIYFLCNMEIRRALKRLFIFKFQVKTTGPITLTTEVSSEKDIEECEPLMTDQSHYDTALVATADIMLATARMDRCPSVHKNSLKSTKLKIFEEYPFIDEFENMLMSNGTTGDNRLITFVSNI